MTTGNSAPANFSQRLIAYAIATLVVVSLLCFVAVIIGTWVGAADDGGFSVGLWPVIITLPLFALPIGMVLTITLLIVSASARAKRERGI